MKIFLNGTLIEQAEAVVSVYDHGFLYGIGLFETFRTYRGRPFLLERHLARLADGCSQLAIKTEFTESDVRKQISELLLANELADGYFRFTVTAGSDILGLPSGEYKHPTVILYVKALPPSDDYVYRNGKPLQLLRTRRNSPEGPVRLKSLHYMNNLLGKMELQASSAVSPERSRISPQPEGLMLTAGGHAAEGIVSNVFFVRDGRLFTPSLDTGILPGITRAFVLQLAAGSGIDTEEGLYTWQDLLDADEVFLTNSIQEIVPVTSLLDEQGAAVSVGTKASSASIGRTGSPGPVTQRLLEKYRKEANLENEPYV